MIEKLEDLAMKMDFLMSLKRTKNFSDVLCDLEGFKWYFYALVNNKHFKQYIDGIVGEGGEFF